ncbi:MAG: penicillin acylase family protein, partial [Acidobacteriota bacterium]
SPISQPAAPAEGLLPDALLEPYAAQLGSNNWAVGGHRSAGGKPILAGDPHLDPRMLPGIWHPVGLVWGDGDGTLRAVGAGVPGIPGLTVMRSSHVAMSVTNAYGDVQDLYIETVDPGDPGRYLEGDRSVPFEVRQEVLRIRDDDAEGGYREHPIEIRSTRRGPVVTGVLPKLRSTETLTLRWAPAETMGPDIGFAHALLARSVDDIDGALRHLTMVGLNFVFADVHGDIAWRVSGRQPIRAPGAGVVPRRVEDLTELEDGDDWLGWIPFEEMPHARNPGRGWVGTANHLTIPADYPHYYTSLAASSYRYRRLVQLLAGDDPLTVDDHWRMQRDTYNTMAAAVAPIMATALEADSTGPNGWIAQVARLLSDWDFHDDPERPEPLLFQEIYRHFASAVFEDELGPELAADLLDNLYFWQERLQAMVTAGDSPWFDDRTTEAVETRDDLFRHAAREAFGRLAPDLGADPGDWRWGDLHRLSLHHPLRPSGFGAGLLGAQSHPLGGSGETLLRGWYAFGDPYEVTFTDSLRMVADLADDEKIRAVLPGGIVGRAFHPHQTDQIEPYLSGEPRWWWFSDDAIEANAVATQRLLPAP